MKTLIDLSLISALITSCAYAEPIIFCVTS